MKKIGIVFSVLLLGVTKFESPPLQAQETGSEQGIITVDVIKPHSETQQNNLQLTGSIESIQDTQLAVQQSGAVKALLVDEGASVNQGDKLLQLDSTIAEHRLDELQAQLSIAKIELQETQRLYEEVLALSKTQVVAETRIAERKAAEARATAILGRQQAAVDLQKEVVARHTVLAPFDGVIAARNADIGEWVTPQQWVFNLISNQGLRLRLAVPQEYFSLLRDNEVVATVTPDSVKSGSANNIQLQLPLSQLVAVSDLSTRTITALIELPETENLISGMSARVSLNVGAKMQNQLWLPQSAVKAHPDGGSSVFAVENGKAKRFVVTLGKKRADEIAIIGANPSLDYVVKGVELLQDGQQVRIGSRLGAK